MGWGKGAIHPNHSNFRRVLRHDVVARVRKHCEWGLLKERPKWLEWAERVPPMENHNLNLQVRKIRNPYPQMVSFLLKKYPDLRFQDCYVDGNDWSAGNDTFRDDHPVMQFVARQLDFMNQGLSKKEAFQRTEEMFRDRREHLEREQKVMMAMALDSGLSPMFSTGRAYLQAEKARAEAAHLQAIQRQLRQLKMEEKAKKPEEAKKDKQERPQLPELRYAERAKLATMQKDRASLVGQTVSVDLAAEASAQPAGDEKIAPGDAAVSERRFEEDPDELEAPAPLSALLDKKPEDSFDDAVADRPAASRAVPDVEDIAKVQPRPPESVEKPESMVTIQTSRARPRGRKALSSKDFGSMLQGRAFDEDDQEGYLDDDALPERRRRRSIAYDDDDIDILPDRPKRGGKGGVGSGGRT